MKKYILLIMVFAWSTVATNAQVAVSDAYNAGSQVYNYSNAETITNHTTTFVGYVANNGGEFYHFGPAVATFTNNGFYNAFDPSINGFVGTPSTPGVDYFQGLDGAQFTDQEIAGTTAPRFGYLILANGAAQNINITNSNGAEVGLRADITNRYTTTVRSNNSTGALRFLINATYLSSNLSDVQYVDGYVGKVGNNAFTFPVGAQNSGTTPDYRPLSISAPATITDHLSISYWKGDVNSGLDPTGGAHARSSLNPTALNGETLVSVSPLGFWDWVVVSGTATLTISISKPREIGPGSYPTSTDIRLVGWNIANAQWELLGNTPASSLSEDATLSGSTGAYAGRTMASYSAIGWGNIVSQPLPIKLASFTALKQGHSSILNWMSATEIGTSYFDVQSSIDGRSFVSIGKVSAAGNASTTQYYTLTDASPKEGNNYYRLKIVDLDGNFSYSDIRSLRFDGSGNPIIVYPNPAHGTFTISGFAASGEKTIRIINPLGQTLQSIALPSGLIVKTMNIESLPASVLYIVQVWQNGKLIMSEKLMKD